MPALRPLLRRLDPRRTRSNAQEVADLREQVARLRARSTRLQARVDKLAGRRRELQAQLRTASGAARTTAVGEVPGVSRLELRRRCALEGVPADPLILEIGPAHNAVFPKREGFRTRTVDYLDRAGLIKRYEDFPHYSPDDIEEVDYVLAPGSAMADVIDERFDVVMASHVLEHTTSMIDFLDECAKLLAPGGTLALVVPDHRYCFDRFRERSSIARVIDASLAPPPVHTVGTVIEERLNASRHRGSTAWLPGHRGDYELIHDTASVLATGEQARVADRYIDTHNWVCTPNHLRLLLQDLHELGFVSLRESFFHDTVRHEFFLNLRLDAPGSGLTREELLVLSENERRSLDEPTFAAPEAGAEPGPEPDPAS